LRYEPGEEPGLANHTVEYDPFIKSNHTQGKVLRFMGKLEHAVGFDVERVFTITYFLDADELSIFEPPVRNSGRTGLPPPQMYIHIIIIYIYTYIYIYICIYTYVYIFRGRVNIYVFTMTYFLDADELSIFERPVR